MIHANENRAPTGFTLLRSIVPEMPLINPLTSQLASDNRVKSKPRLAGLIFLIQAASTIIHAHPNNKQVTMVINSTSAQWKSGGTGPATTAPAAPYPGVAPAPGAPGYTVPPAGGDTGTGILPITCDTGTQSVMPSLRVRSVMAMLPWAR